MISSNFIKHTSGSFFHRLFLHNFNHILVNQVEKLHPNTILDAGCGEGFTLSLLHSRLQHVSLIGIDTSSSAITAGKKLFPFLELSRGDIYHLPFPNHSIDLVLCSEVLEHLSQPKQALKELRRVSKYHLIITVPHEPWFRLINFFRLKYISTWGNHPEHIQHWNPVSFSHLLSTQKLTIKKYIFPFPWILAIVSPKR